VHARLDQRWLFSAQHILFIRLFRLRPARIRNLAGDGSSAIVETTIKMAAGNPMQEAVQERLKPWDKLLPNQPFTSDQFSGAGSVEQSIYETIMWSTGFIAPEKKFKIENTELFTIEQMASNAAALGFLGWLLRLIGAKRVLEIGAFVGVSAMYFADSLPADGRVVTIEKFDHFAGIARRNFAANGFENRIELVEGDAHEVLPNVADRGPFDFAFIDGNKERYADYFRLVEPMMSPRSIIAVDDVFFHGDALSPTPASEKGRGVRAMLELVANSSTWDRAVLPLSNGMMLMSNSTPA
jgi:predicted O-methyltransferase YrrM